jgi:phage gpG-like protein
MSNDLERFGRELHSYLKTVPRLMGKAVVQESADNFRRQGYENDAGSVVSWEPRKAADTMKRRGRRVPNPRQRAILVKTGRLRRSVRIVATTATSVTVGSSEAYAQVQQEGNDRGLPARPFITVGKGLRNKLTRRIAADITKLLK